MQFIKIEDQCLLQSGGIFRVADLYSYNGRLFAKYGSGFVGLYKKDPCGVFGTTKRGVTFQMDNATYRHDASGRLCL